MGQLCSCVHICIQLEHGMAGAHFKGSCALVCIAAFSLDMALHVHTLRVSYALVCIAALRYQYQGQAVDRGMEGAQFMGQLWSCVHISITVDNGMAGAQFKGQVHNSKGSCALVNIAASYIV